MDNYYRLQKALKDVAVDFGYEFIDPDWLLDFPRDDEQPSAQPWMTVAGAGSKESAPDPAGPRARGAPPPGLPTARGPGGPPGALGSPGSGDRSGLHGLAHDDGKVRQSIRATAATV